MTLFTTKFWADTAERAIKTAAQSVLSLTLAGDQVFNIVSLDWSAVLGVSVGAALISVLMSITSASITSSDSASLSVKSISK